MTCKCGFIRSHPLALGPDPLALGPGGALSRSDSGIEVARVVEAKKEKGKINGPGPLSQTDLDVPGIDVARVVEVTAFPTPPLPA